MYDDIFENLFDENFGIDNDEMEVFDEGLEVIQESTFDMSMSEFKKILPKIASLIKTKNAKKSYNYNIGSMSSDEKNGISQIFVPVNSGTGKHDGSKRRMIKSGGITFIIYEAKDNTIDAPFSFFYRDSKNVLRFKMATSYLKKVKKDLK